MKNSKTHLSSISILAGVVIAILALARGTFQTWLLLGVLTLWGLWLLASSLLPRMRQARRRRRSRRHQGQPQTIDIAPHAQPLTSEAVGIPVETLLLRHVNHRISAHLRSAYPDATWEWTEKNPRKLALLGGTGRIRVFNVPDFDHADITLDTQANINCSMIRTMALPESENGSGAGGQAPPNKQPVDPQIWYEIQGRRVLESLVADLNSRGHSCLTLNEDGDACVEEDKKEVPKEHLPGFPEKLYWPRLAQVLEGNGLAAEVTPGGIRVSW